MIRFMFPKSLLHLSGFLCVAFLLISLNTAATESPESSYASASKIKIGVVAGLSGNLAAWGTDIKNTLLFANERLGEGRLEFVFEDDHCLGKDAAPAVHKLIDIDKVNVIMIAHSESILTTDKIVGQSGIVNISPSASAAPISGIDPHVFRTWPSDALAAKKLYDFMAKQHKKIGILSELRGYSQELLNAIQNLKQNRNVEIVNEDYLTSDTDLRTALLRLKSKGIDALMLNANGEGTLLNMIKQLKELHISMPLYGAYIPGSLAFREKAKELAEGIIFVDGPSLSILNNEGTQIFQLFVSQYGSPQSSPFVFASTYEAFRLIAEGTKLRGDLRTYLLTNTFHGLFGSYSFDSNGDVKGISHVLKVIKQGEAVELKEE